VDRATAVARQRVEDAEAASKPDQNDIRNAKKVVVTTTKPDMTFVEMLNAISDRPNDFASSDDGEDGEDEDDDEGNPELDKLHEDDKPCMVMCTLSQMVQHRMKRSRQK